MACTKNQRPKQKTQTTKTHPNTHSTRQKSSKTGKKPTRHNNSVTPQNLQKPQKQPQTKNQPKNPDFKSPNPHAPTKKIHHFVTNSSNFTKTNTKSSPLKNTSKQLFEHPKQSPTQNREEATASWKKTSVSFHKKKQTQKK